jgi:hypothetical protein
MIYLRSSMRKSSQPNWPTDTLDTVLIWIDSSMNWYGSPSGKRGRSQTFSDTAIEFCLIIKELFHLPLRDAIELSGYLLKSLGLEWKVPDYSTLSRRKGRQSLTLMHLSNSQQLHLLIENSGITAVPTPQGVMRKNFLSRLDRERQWRKLDLNIKTK